MSLILALGLVLVFGSFMGRMAEKIRLSSIVGFLACGIVIGSVWPEVTQFITDDGISTFTTIGLAMIAFMIGEELYLPKLRLMGKETLKVVFIQALVTMLLVATVTVVLGNSVSLGLILGAIAAATAPATAFMVTKKYRTSGQLTQMLLPIVALDDAVSIVFFTVAMAVGTVVEGITGGIASAIGLASWELFGSLALGLAIGLVMSYMVRFTKGGDELRTMVIGMIFVAAGAAMRMHVSAIMTCMVAGATITNLLRENRARKLLSAVDRFAPPIYVVLFTFAGVLFDWRLFCLYIPLFAAYILVRIVGKVLGVKLAFVANKDGRTVGNYLGIALLSQSGLAVGLTLAVRGFLGEYEALVITMIVPAVLVFEIISSPLMKFALRKAGEIAVPCQGDETSQAS